MRDLMIQLEWLRYHPYSMMRKAMYYPLCALFALWMRALLPFRRYGVFGTPDDPIYYDKGDPIPWWILCRWPLNERVTFGADVETYYVEDWAAHCRYGFGFYHQLIRPQHETLHPCDLIVDDPDRFKHGLVIGAPTELCGTPRPHRGKRAGARRNQGGVIPKQWFA